MRPCRAARIAWLTLWVVVPLASLPQDVSAASTTQPLPYISTQFHRLPRPSQIAAVRAVQDFMRQWEGVLSDTYAGDEAGTNRLRQATERWASLLSGIEEQAQAEETARRCLYGGWNSTLSSAGRCLSPERGNPRYAELFKKAGCQAGEFLCSPALFGPKTCLPRSKRVGRDAAETRALVSSTYQNCRRQFRGSVDELVAHLTSDRDAFAVFQETVLAIDAACEGDAPHPQKRGGMCSSISAAFGRIAAKYRQKYPDLGQASECYDALDEIKGCAGGASHTRSECGYPPLVRMYRSPGPGGEVIVSTPSKADLGKDEGVVDMNLYLIRGAVLGANKDVVALAGKPLEQVKAAAFWNAPAAFSRFYPALLFEITQQMRERLVEYRAIAAQDQKEAFRARFDTAIRECVGISHNADFMAARREACRAVAQDPATCEPPAEPVGTGRSGPAQPAR
jgi:hypothetical protein